MSSANNSIQTNDAPTNSIDKNVEKGAASPKKKFLGGYKNKFTGIVYHHANVQTLPSPWKHELILRFHRDSQTMEQRHQTQQTPRDACTQVQAEKIFLSTTDDKNLITTGNYQCADDIRKEFICKVIILQKYARRWLAQRELLKRKKNLSLQCAWDQENVQNKRQQHIDWLKSLENRRLNPRTEEDFMLMFSDLQKWWENEEKCIAAVRSGPELKAAMWLLVSEEVKKISAIDKMKSLSIQKQDSLFREKSLEMAAQPKLWKAYNSLVEVDTENTHKGRYLQTLYQTLSMPYLSSNDRIAALTNLKEILQLYQSRLTESLIQLANREIDLILRGTKSDRLEGLRSRIRDLFWQFAKQPMYNPQIQGTKDKDKSSQHIICCSSCKRFYTLQPNSRNASLEKSISSNNFVKCNKCLYIENEAWRRKDLEFYKILLQCLINDEEKKTNFSGLVYILQPADIKHLVDKIWKRQSCISGLSKEDDLELIRFDSEKNWTPWNCLLVTKKEAQTLQKTPNLEIKYDKKFRKCAVQRHAEARMYFSSIPRYLPYIPQHCKSYSMSDEDAQ